MAADRSPGGSARGREVVGLKAHATNGRGRASAAAASGHVEAGRGRRPLHVGRVPARPGGAEPRAALGRRASARDGRRRGGGLGRVEAARTAGGCPQALGRRGHPPWGRIAGLLRGVPGVPLARFGANVAVVREFRRPDVERCSPRSPILLERTRAFARFTFEKRSCRCRPAQSRNWYPTAGSGSSPPRTGRSISSTVPVWTRV